MPPIEFCKKEMCCSLFYATYPFFDAIEKGYCDCEMKEPKYVKYCPRIDKAADCKW